MKKNIKTYLLLAVVATIWGTIGYKILFSLSSEPTVFLASKVSDFKPLPQKEKDTFSIVADYRDPFLGTLPKKSMKKRKRIAKPTPPPLPEIDIRFTGLIIDRDTKEKIYFVTINGQQHLMGVKDEIQKVKLVSGTSSSIKVRCNNKTRTIKLGE